MFHIDSAHAGNKLESAGDIEQLQHNSNLVMLDLSNNRLCDEQAVHQLTALPLSLLKLNGNPVVGHMRSGTPSAWKELP